jgi:[ribosomal protein S18]-alanine N-acetyltransferase
VSAQPIPSKRKPAALPDRPGAFFPMELSDVPRIAAIEKEIYAAPWTEGNFVDSLAAGYCAWTLRASDRFGRRIAPTSSAIIGYFVLMAAVDEAHLLNVSVAPGWQAKGHGVLLLHKVAMLAAEYRASSVILEVRPSNTRALDVYRRFGFREHGRRRRYYPASAEDHQSREDAIVMRLQL